MKEVRNLVISDNEIESKTVWAKREEVVDCLNDIMVALVAGAVALHEQAERRKRVEEERARLARLEHEETTQHEHEAQRVQQLIADADGWTRGERLRRFADAIEAHAIARSPSAVPIELSAWLAWVHYVADGTDPTVFIIIGNQNSITYIDVFKLIHADKLWLGASIHSGDREFGVPNHYPLEAAGSRVDKDGNKFIRVKGVRWFTNRDYEARHEELALFATYSPEAYPTYDNYDAIEVSKTKDIPVDYDGVMGVPITFLDKYSPDQFEIVGTTESNDPENSYRTRVYSSKECRPAYLKRFGKPGVYDLNASGVLNGIKLLKRVLIRKKESK